MREETRRFIDLITTLAASELSRDTYIRGVEVTSEDDAVSYLMPIAIVVSCGVVRSFQTKAVTHYSEV